MTTKYDSNDSGPIIRCAIYALQSARKTGPQKQGVHFKLLKDELSSALSGLAIIQQASSPGWLADTDNPGFLIRQSGFVFIRIPAHLVRLFPSSNELDKIWEIGTQIKTTTNSILHISGSNAVKEVFTFVSDIDFCEYTADSPSEIAQSITDLISRPNFPGWCIKVKVADNEFLSPFALDDIKSKASTLNYLCTDSCSFKIDYLMDYDGHERPYEVTNLGIVCNQNYESVGFDRTFAYQQAQIAATDIVPTRLDDPAEAGRYALHLLREVDIYKKSGDMLKMLKRLLSLVRFFYFRELTGKFNSLFDHSKMLVESEIKEVDRLLHYIQASTQQHCIYAINTNLVDKLNRYRTILSLELKIAEEKEKKYFPGGVPIEVANLFQNTSEKLQRESGGVLTL